MTQTTEQYNGWPNRETWATALHIDNDEGTYLYRCELAAQAWNEPFPAPYPPRTTTGCAADAVREQHQHFATRRLADWLEQFVSEEFERVTHEPAEATEWARMALADVGSLWRVDWWYIAEHYIAEHCDESERS